MSTAALAAGFAQLIGDAGIGVYSTTGTYAANAVGISDRGLLQSPDKLIVVTVYPISDDVQLNDSVAGVQIRTRGDSNPNTVQDLDDAVFNVLQGLTNVAVGGVHVVLMWRQSAVPGPQDMNNRWENASTYYARYTNPTAHRPD